MSPSGEAGFVGGPSSWALPRIGEIFGGRDHTTVLHAQRKIAELMHQRKQLLQQVNELANRIKLG